MAAHIFQDRKSEGEFKINYDDSPPTKPWAFNGLESFPLINQALSTANLLDWIMWPGEQVALIFVLERLRPKVAIEIGTKEGGSLQALSHFSDKVYSIDIDPEVPRQLAGRFPNVEYLTGYSEQILPSLIDRLQQEKAELSFALVDGAHSIDGVRNDINNLLRFRPMVPFYILMHDSFNPSCRLGIRQANWSANRYVHAVELDFIPGVVHSGPSLRNELGGGLAMGVLLPHERQGRFEITGGAERTRQAVLISPRLFSTHLVSYSRRAVNKAKRMLIGESNKTA
jgi:hypothetical protein